MPIPLYQDPYLSQQLALMQEPARARAEALRQIAEAQSRATLAGGAAAGQIAQSIGTAAQQVAGIPQQNKDQQIRDLQKERLTQEVEAGRQSAGDLKALDTAFSQPGGRDAIINALPGHLKPTVMKQFTEADELAAKAQKAQAETESAQNDYAGSLAAGVKAHGYDPAAAQLALSHAKSTFGQNPAWLAQITRIEQAIQADPTPQTVQKFIDPLIAQSPKQAELAQNAEKLAEEIRKNKAAEAKPKPEAKTDMVIKGTTNVPIFDANSGKWSFNGQEVPADQVVKAPPVKDPIAVALEKVALQNAQQNLSDKQRRSNDVNAITEGITNGDIPPDPEGLQRNGLYGDVVANLHNKGINFNNLRQAYLAQKRLIQTENSPQGVRLDIAVRSGLAMYDKIDELSSKWQGMGLGPLSRLDLKAATEGAKGQAAQQLAIELNGQISQLTSDVATVEQNGMTPTEESRKVAETSMQSWWGDKTIQAMTAQGRANMKIRDMARKETVPLVPGQAQPAAAESGVIYAKDPQGNIHQAKAGTPLPQGWTLVQKP